VLCTQDCWKSKGIPFLWLTQLESSCHSNMRSQLSWFCFILNKLFLLRKMVFLPGSELTTNVWPLCLRRRGYLLLLLNVCSDSCGSWARSRENRHFRVDQPVVPKWKKSSWLPCCGTPFAGSEKRGSLAALLLTLTRKRCWCWHARSREAPPCVSERCTRLGLRWFEELEFLNFKFLIYFVHPTRLALVLIIFVF